MKCDKCGTELEEYGGCPPLDDAGEHETRGYERGLRHGAAQHARARLPDAADGSEEGVK